MYSLLKLKREISETTANINPDDVFSVKNKLKEMGYYKMPEWGMTKFTDNQMFDGIRQFQKDNGLKIDGVIKPEGETENTINKKIKDRIWGDKTKKVLDVYLNSDHSYPGNIRSGIVAPYNDMVRNFNDMNKLGLKGADKFFHCKGNYEAAKRGAWGRVIATSMSAVKEAKDLIKYGVTDSLADWRANQKGWRGAKEGKSLQESCPTHPRRYK